MSPHPPPDIRAARRLHNPKAVTYTVLPPSALQVSHPSLSEDMLGGWRIVVCADSQPDFFPKVVSRAGWWSLGLAMMQRVARHLGCNSSREAKLFGVVFRVIQETLDCTEDDAFKFCMERCPEGRLTLITKRAPKGRLWYL